MLLTESYWNQIFKTLRTIRSPLARKSPRHVPIPRRHLFFATCPVRRFITLQINASTLHDNQRAGRDAVWIFSARRPWCTSRTAANKVICVTQVRESIHHTADRSTLNIQRVAGLLFQFSNGYRKSAESARPLSMQIRISAESSSIDSAASFSSHRSRFE